MRKKYIFIIAILLIVLAAAVVTTIYTWPGEIDAEYDGIVFRTGDSMPGYSEPVIVRLNGHYIRKLFGDNMFLGQFEIRGWENAENADNTDVEIHFDKKGRGKLDYVILTAGGGVEFIDIGTIYVNPKWSEIFITIPDFTSKTESSVTGHWSAGDGLVMAMPARNREEAMDVFNDLLLEYYDYMTSRIN